MGGELVRRLHQLLHLLIGGAQDLLIVPLQLPGEHTEQLVLRHILHLLVGIPNLGIVIFNRCGQVAGEDLPGVVVQCRHGHLSLVHMAVKELVADHRQGVGQHRHLMAVLLDILGIAVAHKGPAVYEAHTVDISKKMAHGAISPFKTLPSTAVMRTGRRQLWRFSPGAETSI